MNATRFQHFLHPVLALFLLATLNACASSTSPGAIGVQRKQLLLVPSESLEQAANATFTATTKKAQESGALVQGAEAENLKGIASRLIRQVGVYRQDAQRWNWQVALIDSKDLNAFCMPGGKIVFFTGIIRTLQLNNNEIAAIMGHEMAHALREHSREQASEQVGLSAIKEAASLGASLFGLPTNTGSIGNTAMTYLVTLPHSRRHETEADQMGLELMARAGYNPEAAISLWQKMGAANKAGTPQFMSTHPSHATRIKDLQGLMPVVRPLYQQSGGAKQGTAHGQ